MAVGIDKPGITIAREASITSASAAVIFGLTSAILLPRINTSACSKSPTLLSSESTHPFLIRIGLPGACAAGGVCADEGCVAITEATGAAPSRPPRYRGTFSATGLGVRSIRTRTERKMNARPSPRSLSPPMSIFDPQPYGDDAIVSGQPNPDDCSLIVRTGMRTEQAQPIRLQDYRAPDWTIERVDLDISLDPSKTRVRTKLTISPATWRDGPSSPQAGRRRTDIRLSFHERTAGRVGRLLGDADSLTILQPPQQRFVLEIENAGGPLGEHTAHGALPVQRHLLHPMRGGRISPHHLLPRPTRCDVGLYDEDRSSRAEAPRLLANGNLIEAGECLARSTFCRVAGSFPQTIRTCSPWSAATSPASRTHLSPRPAAP